MSSGDSFKDTNTLGSGTLPYDLVETQLPSYRLYLQIQKHWGLDQHMNLGGEKGQNLVHRNIKCEYLFLIKII